MGFLLQNKLVEIMIEDKGKIEGTIHPYLIVAKK